MRRVATYAILLAWAVVVVFPFYWAVITSFKRPLDVYQRTLVLPWIQFTPTLSAWEYVFGGMASQVVNPFINSLIFSTLAALFSMVLGGVAGFGLSRYQYRLGPWRSSDDVAFFFLSQKFLPPIVISLPLLIMFKQLDLVDTIPGMVIAYTGFSIPFTVWITREFFSHIPRELEESARLDGCTLLGALVRIVLPLARPGLIAAFLFSFIFTWNDLLISLTLTFQSGGTMPVVIAGQQTVRGPEWWNLSAIAVLSLIPSLIVGAILLKFVSGGLARGSEK